MIGKKLREHRKAQGLSQAQLGAELGLSASSIAMWETDKRDPDIQTLLELSNFWEWILTAFSMPMILQTL